MKIHLHDIVYRRLCEVAAGQGKTKKAVIQDALIRLLGLEGLPIPEDEIYGQPEAAPPPAE